MYTRDVALHIKTDSEFDQALSWIAEQEGRSKSEVVRETVLSRYQAKRSGFRFGILKDLAEPGLNRRAILEELKNMDEDSDASS